MFVAKRKDGSFFSLLDWKERDEIERLTKGEKFYCPACESSLQLKHGQFRKVHFAHLNQECKTSSEPETPYHMEGKAKLYKLLRHSGQTELEAYIPSTRQRADVFAVIKNQRYAFEFQCSDISAKEFSHRTNLYERSGIKPVWIIGKEKLGNIGSTMKLSPFQWRFLQRPSPKDPAFLLSFCPETTLFYYLFPSFSINSTTTALSFISHEKWFESPLISKVPPNAEWKNHYLHYKKKWRYIYSLYKPYYKLRNYCYSKMHIPFSLFPAEIGLPVPSFYRLHTPIIEWQAWLYFDSIYNTPSSSIIHLPSVLQRFKLRLKNTQIRVRDLPLIKGGSYEDAVVEYMNILVKIGVLERENALIYRKKRQDLPMDTMEEAVKKDRFVLDSILKS